MVIEMPNKLLQFYKQIQRYEPITLETKILQVVDREINTQLPQKIEVPIELLNDEKNNVYIEIPGYLYSHIEYLAYKNKTTMQSIILSLLSKEYIYLTERGYKL